MSHHGGRPAPADVAQVGPQTPGTRLSHGARPGSSIPRGRSAPRPRRTPSITRQSAAEAAEALLADVQDRHLRPEPSSELLARTRATALGALGAARAKATETAPSARLVDLMAGAGTDVPGLARNLGIGRAPLVDLVQGRVSLPVPTALLSLLADALRSSVAVVDAAVTQVDWRGEGYEGRRPGQLLAEHRLFHYGHRALDDVLALVHLLRQPLTLGATGFSLMMHEAARTTVRIWAEHAAYERKDALKARGYRWSAGGGGLPRAWYRDVPEPAAGGELAYLRSEIYGDPAAAPTLRRITARDRFSTRADAPRR